LQKIPDIFNDKQMIFGLLFNMSNKLQRLMDRDLSPYDMTSKQWYLSVVLQHFFDKPPTLNQLADTMEYSHQNVKQLADKLAQKGFLRYERDKKDRRAIRLQLTEKSHAFWQSRDEQANQFINDIYKGLTDDELSLISKGLQKISENLSLLDNSIHEEDEA